MNHLKSDQITEAITKMRRTAAMIDITIVMIILVAAYAAVRYYYPPILAALINLFR
jgi:hypothetical protein